MSVEVALFFCTMNEGDRFYCEKFVVDPILHIGLLVERICEDNKPLVVLGNFIPTIAKKPVFELYSAADNRRIRAWEVLSIAKGAAPIPILIVGVKKIHELGCIYFRLAKSDKDREYMYASDTKVYAISWGDFRRGYQMRGVDPFDWCSVS